MARLQGKPAQATLLIKKTVVILSSLQLVPPPSNTHTHMLRPVEAQMWSMVWFVSPKRETDQTEQTKPEKRNESFRFLLNANRGIQDPPIILSHPIRWIDFVQGSLSTEQAVFSSTVTLAARVLWEHLLLTCLCLTGKIKVSKWEFLQLEQEFSWN